MWTSDDISEKFSNDVTGYVISLHLQNWRRINYVKMLVPMVFRGSQLRLSVVFRVSLHYSYSFLVLLPECSCRNSYPLGIFKFAAITVTVVSKIITPEFLFFPSGVIYYAGNFLPQIIF